MSFVCETLKTKISNNYHLFPVVSWVTPTYDRFCSFSFRKRFIFWSETTTGRLFTPMFQVITLINKQKITSRTSHFAEMKPTGKAADRRSFSTDKVGDPSFKHSQLNILSGDLSRPQECWDRDGNCLNAHCRVKYPTIATDPKRSDGDWELKVTTLSIQYPDYSTQSQLSDISPRQTDQRPYKFTCRCSEKTELRW